MLLLIMKPLYDQFCVRVYMMSESKTYEFKPWWIKNYSTYNKILGLAVARCVP